MRRLYVRIAVGVILAVIVGWIAMGLLVMQFRGALGERVLDQASGNSLPAIQAGLETSPKDRWPEHLAKARQQLAMPLEIVSADRVPSQHAISGSNGSPAPIRSRLGPPSIYLPLHGGSHYLVAGPPPPPPLGPLIVDALIFVLVLTVTASAAVGIPLVRQLRSLQNAIGELDRVNLTARVDTHVEGALSDFAESINRTAAQLRRQFEEREALLQAVSHEIGTPLSRMRFHVELLDRELRFPEHRRRLRALSEDLDELDELGTELVGWMEADGNPRAERDFEVGPVLESIVELERHGSGAASINVTVSVVTDATIRADQRQFERAIENVLRNALRYAQEHIVVKVECDDASVIVEVRDDGPGIPRDQWERVLEPFVRGDSSPSRAHRGLGLGLAIVRRIVEAHDGTVSITNAAEGGTRVRTSWKRVHGGRRLALLGATWGLS